MKEQFCQCCAMPMKSDDNIYGTNADGSINKDYCKYCFDNGKFTFDGTMDEMIEFCIPHMIQANPQISENEAREEMLKFFPMLKRWKKD